MFAYGAAEVGYDNGRPQSHEAEALSSSDRFNEERVIDILANVDRDALGDDGMVTHREDSLAGTLAGIAGNVLEWYDFAVFGYFSDVIGDVFFPPDQKGNAALVESFVVFGGAFFARPLGGMLMGYIGDRWGSRRALTLSIFLMAFPTFLMGCLPGYASVGSLAIVLLTLVRLMQGLSVGGQLMSSLVFTLERHPKAKWGLYGSYVMAAANLGTFLGGLVASVIRGSLSEEDLRSWGWRIPFLSGILVSVSGFYLRSHGGEDEERPAEAAGVNPIWLAFGRSNLRSLLASTMVPLLWSGGFYLSFVWMAVYMSELIESPVPNSFAVNSASLGLGPCLLFPMAGWLSDKWGRKRVMALGGVAMGVASPLMIAIIGEGRAAPAFAAQMVLGLALSLWGAPMMAWLAEAFDPAARLTSVSIGYNIAQALSGGLAPAIATYMVDKLGPNSPGYYLSAFAFVSLIGLFCVAPRKPTHFVLPGEDDSEWSAKSEGHSELNSTVRGDREMI